MTNIDMEGGGDNNKVKNKLLVQSEIFRGFVVFASKVATRDDEWSGCKGEHLPQQQRLGHCCVEWPPRLLHAN